MMAIGLLQAKAREKMTHDESNNEQDAWFRRLGGEDFVTEDQVVARKVSWEGAGRSSQARLPVEDTGPSQLQPLRTELARFKARAEKV